MSVHLLACCCCTGRMMAIDQRSTSGDVNDINEKGDRKE